MYGKILCSFFFDTCILVANNIQHLGSHWEWETETKGGKRNEIHLFVERIARLDNNANIILKCVEAFAQNCELIPPISN